MLYNYFKQLFAQVTNPAIDSIREKVVMSLEFCRTGKNVLEETPLHAHKLRIKNPILTDEELEKIRYQRKQFPAKTIFTFFGADNPKKVLRRL